MKKIINHPDLVVSETLKGLALAEPTLEYIPDVEVIAKKVKSGLFRRSGFVEQVCAPDF